MTDPFGFTSSPLLRDHSSLPSGDSVNQGMMARLAAVEGFVDPVYSAERTTVDVATSPTLNFPLPSSTGSEVRNPAPFGLQQYYGFSQPYDPGPTGSAANENNQSSGPNGNGVGLGIGLALPPLRCPPPDRPFASSNPASSISTSTATTASSYFGLNQPPPHTYPGHSSSSTSSEQIYTPTTSGGYSQSAYLTPPATNPDGQATSLPSLNLPGVTSLFPQPPPIQLPLPTTVEPKTFSQWSSTGPGLGRGLDLRGSTSSLSLRDSRFSVSPLSGAALSISRSTSVESEYPRPGGPGGPDVVGHHHHPHHHHHHHPLTTVVPKMEAYDAATMVVYGGRGGPEPGDMWTMREGDICFTDEAEVKQSAYVKRRCYNCDHRSPPSWRKSVLAPGKILCNKCGIFERTHNRPRPPQADDLKLRRRLTPPSDMGVSVSVSVSAATSASSYSSPTSQYSRAPTTTPLSATFPSPAPTHAIQLPPVRTTFWSSPDAGANGNKNANAGVPQSPPPGYGFTHSHSHARGVSPPASPGVSVGYAPYPRPGSLRRAR